MISRSYIEDFRLKRIITLFLSLLIMNLMVFHQFDANDLAFDNIREKPIKIPKVANNVNNYYTCDTPSNATSVAVEGNYAFVTDNVSGLYVIDIVDPENPVISGICDTSGNALDLKVSGDIVFVADGPDGLKIINTTDPFNPVIIGSCDTAGTAYSVDVSGNVAYIADGSSGLQILDITDLTNPTIIQSYATANNALDLVVEGDFSFIAVDTFGLEIVDVRNPNSPTQEGICGLSGSAIDIEIVGDLAYIASNKSGIHVVDITDIAAPSLKNSTLTTDSTLSIDIFGNYAYVTDNSTGLELFDISNETSLIRKGCFNTPSIANDVFIYGERAYIADDITGLIIANISDHIFGLLPNNSISLLDGAWDIEISGNMAYVASGSSGIHVVNITDPNKCDIIGSDITYSHATGLEISGDYLYVADGSAGLCIVDISDPEHPSRVTFEWTNDFARDIEISGNYVYIADDEGGIQIFDISIPTWPTKVGSYSLLGNTRDIEIVGDLLYVLNSNYYVIGSESALTILNISNPSTPTFIKNITGLQYIRDCYCLEISGDYAFVGDFELGLLVFDIGDLYNPSLIGNDYQMPQIVDLRVVGDFLYGVDATFGILCYDITDVRYPFRVNLNTQALNGNWAIDLSGDYVYMVGRDGTGYDPFFHSIKISNNYGLDIDSDGLSSFDEIFTYQSHRNNTDSDNDSLLDGVEVFELGTNPSSDDTDQDNMLDAWELLYDFNPISSEDNETDFDGDGLLNVEEFNFNTNASNIDSDLDGLLDGVEVHNLNSNPASNDSDNDDIPDGYEVEFELDLHRDDAFDDKDKDGLSNLQEYNIGTNPLKEDTDQDGFNDNIEVIQGFDPLDPESKPPKEINWGLWAIIIVSVLAAIIIIPYYIKVKGILIKKSKLRIISNIDFYTRGKKLTNYLLSQEEISEISYLSDMLDSYDQDKFQDHFAQNNVILLYINPKVLESVFIKIITKISLDYDLLIIPIIDKKVEWSELSKVGLSRELGIQIKDDFNEFKNEIYQYLSTCYRDYNNIKILLNLSPIVFIESIKKNLDLGRDQIIKIIRNLVHNENIEGFFSEDQSQFLSKDEILRRLHIMNEQAGIVDTQRFLDMLGLEKKARPELVEIIEDYKESIKEKKAIYVSNSVISPRNEQDIPRQINIITNLNVFGIDSDEKKQIASYIRKMNGIKKIFYLNDILESSEGEILQSLLSEMHLMLLFVNEKVLESILIKIAPKIAKENDIDLIPIYSDNIDSKRLSRNGIHTKKGIKYTPNINKLLINLTTGLEPIIKRINSVLTKHPKSIARIKKSEDKSIESVVYS
ncbi:MAG: hypothetical protein GF364_11990 [Candidatus Lokiarchaeota archaeon]|nr:hypothetical protein [Candidatus Lokiarchaeota archaeon]